MRFPLPAVLIAVTLIASCANEPDDMVDPIAEEPEAVADDTLSMFVGQYSGTMVVYDSVPSAGHLLDSSYSVIVTVSQPGYDSTLLRFTTEPEQWWADELVEIDSSGHFYYGYVQMNYHRTIEGDVDAIADPDSLTFHTQKLQWTDYGSFDSWFKGVRIQ